MKYVKFILSIVTCCILLSSCISNEPDSQSGKLDEAAVMEYLPYSEGQKMGFWDDFGSNINYSVTHVDHLSAEGKKSVSVVMKGKDYDGYDGYNIEILASCINKKRIEISFIYTFRVNDGVYTQKGTCEYVDQKKTGEIPQILTLLNQENVEVAKIEYKKGLVRYSDYNQVRFKAAN